MAQAKNTADISDLNPALLTNITTPIILEQQGQPVAVVMSMVEYEQYQVLQQQKRQISAAEARRLANHVVFGDLVGCALSSGQPMLQQIPSPRWKIPYRTFDHTLLKVVEVNALTGEVYLTPDERTTLLAEVERLTTIDAT